MRERSPTPKGALRFVCPFILKVLEEAARMTGKRTNRRPGMRTQDDEGVKYNSSSPPWTRLPNR